MATQVLMPKLGESVIEGTVIKWLKQEGDQVEEFEPLLEVTTDKVDTEIPSPASGTLLKHYVAEGKTVSAGTPLAVIGEPGESVPDVPPAAQAVDTPMAHAAERVSDPSVVPTRAVSRVGKVRDLGFISPVVARIAAQENVDLNEVDGTGSGGRITKKDVLAYLDVRGSRPEDAKPWEQPASGELFRPSEEIFGDLAARKQSKEAVEPGGVRPLDHVRKAIAEHMVRSNLTSPHVSTVLEADMSRVIAHREAFKQSYADEGIKLTYTPYFVAACAAALKHLPIVNSSWTDEGIRLHRDANIGVAVSLGEEGLIVPVIKQADQRSLRGLALMVHDLAERARARKLKPDEVQGGTFTITNHGVSGSLFATPIINQPQAAILGVGTIQKRVVVLEAPTPDGEVADVIAIRPMVYISLTFDHRILDGAQADQFLQKVIESLESRS